MRLIIYLTSTLTFTAAMAAVTVVSTNKTVTTAGTRVRVTSSSTLATSVVLQAGCNNTGYQYVGDSTLTTANGIRLSACEKFAISADSLPTSAMGSIDLTNLYLDSSVSGEGSSVFYLRSK
jgi:hypothetical protein